MGNSEEENNVLHFSIIPNDLITDKKVMRATPQQVYAVSHKVLVAEIAAASGTPDNVVETVLTTMAGCVSQHCQNGHAIKCSVFNVKPILKGNVAENQTVLHYPDQKVVYRMSLGSDIEVNYETIKTQKVDSSTHTVVISSIEDGITETVNTTLTSKGTGIITGADMKFNEANADEGIFVFTTSEQVKADKIYLNTNKTIQFRIPQLAAGEKYEVEVRKRFTKNKKLYSCVFPGIFTAVEVTNE